MQTKHILKLGFIIPVIFWATTILCGLILKDYNHLSNMVSELGALGTKTQYIFTVGLLLCSLLNFFFVYELYRVSKKHKINFIPVLILLCFSFIAGPALFPMPMKLHSISGLPFPFLILSPMLAIILWNKRENLLKARNTAIFCLIIMLFGFLIFFPEILREYFGLKQRFLYAGWSLWSIFLGHRFLLVYKGKH